MAGKGGWKLYGAGAGIYKVKAAAELTGLGERVEVQPYVHGLTDKTEAFRAKSIALGSNGVSAAANLPNNGNAAGGQDDGDGVPVPVLEVQGEDGAWSCITGSHAICRFVAHEALRLNPKCPSDVYPRDGTRRGLVDSWLDFASSVSRVLGQALGGKGGAEELRGTLLPAVEARLERANFLAGEGVTLADVVVFCDLAILFCHFMADGERAKWPCVRRWVATMQENKVVRQVMPHIRDEGKGNKVFQCKKNKENPLPVLFPESFGSGKWTSSNVRQAFMDFFQLREHTLVPSSPVVPHDDLTLLFANAGMNQFKPIFVGKADPNSSLGQLRRAVDTQKCIRAGGKHNDLDDVGKDTYHHTFFEMLGNWSFGDFFKREAILWSWELLTEVYGLPEERLYATYFGGDEKLGLPADLEARDIWLQVLPQERVMPFGCKDNFWEMGDTGPCGPCTEIHFDRVGGRDCSSLVNADDATVIELWNLVFIQFNREEANGTLNPLPNKHVDTGMGLERIVSVLQGKMSNYDTDVFGPLFAAIREVTDAPREYAGGVGPSEDPDNVDMAYRVIADHIRTLSFAIADGSRPGNEGREYVLRRVLRRAVRYGREVLGAKEGFFSKLVPVFADLMCHVFPELKRAQAQIISIIAEEEASFGRTLVKGIERFKRASQQAVPSSSGAKGPAVISGADAFVLWDTFGFPVDLTQLMAEERGLQVDMEGFKAAMDRAREISRSSGKGDSNAFRFRFEADQTAHLRKDLGLKATNDKPKYLPGGSTAEATIGAIIAGGSNAFVEKIDGDTQAALVLDTTTFYAEQGGQVADIGVIDIQAGSGAVSQFQVTNTQLAAGFVFHIGSLINGGTISVGDKAVTKVDYERRTKIMPNHTCTHILNYVLRKHLGDGIHQKGSLVDAEKLRFDFSHGSAVNVSILQKVENDVRAAIEAELPVHGMEVALDKAKAINGLRAVFGEVYPDPVRVLSVGKSVDAILADPNSDENCNYSIEFCGGTHLGCTKEAQAFALLAEEGIAKGVRRIVAATRSLAQDAIDLGNELNAKADKLEKMKEKNALEKELNHIKIEVDRSVIPVVLKAEIRTKLAAQSKKLLEMAKKSAGENKKIAVDNAIQAVKAAAKDNRKVCVLQIDVGLDSKALLEAVDAALKAEEAMALMVFSADQAKKKVMAYAGVPKDSIAKGLDAPKWIRESLAVCGGKGGGKPQRAQGQGSGIDMLQKAMEIALQLGQNTLG